MVVEVEKSKYLYDGSLFRPLINGTKRAAVIKGTRDSIQWHTERPWRMRLRTSSPLPRQRLFSAVLFAFCVSHARYRSTFLLHSACHLVRVNGTVFFPLARLSCLSAGHEARLKRIEEISSLSLSLCLSVSLSLAAAALVRSFIFAIRGRRSPSGREATDAHVKLTLCKCLDGRAPSRDDGNWKIVL